MATYEPITATITTERRTHDWIAYANGNRGVWEAGRSEGEALGKLHIRLAVEEENDHQRPRTTDGKTARDRLEEAFIALRAQGYRAGIYESRSAPTGIQPSAVVMASRAEQSFNLLGDLRRELMVHVHLPEAVPVVRDALLASGLNVKLRGEGVSYLYVTGVKEVAQ